uniref:Uncharacterized protein n=1 Tax=viral metagenome TaxID=1070528 RepID=A0A6C0IHV0_9ZZZZ
MHFLRKSAQKCIFKKKCAKIFLVLFLKNALFLKKCIFAHFFLKSAK